MRLILRDFTVYVVEYYHLFRLDSVNFPCPFFSFLYFVYRATIIIRDIKQVSQRTSWAMHSKYLTLTFLKPISLVSCREISSFCIALRLITVVCIIFISEIFHHSANRTQFSRHHIQQIAKVTELHGNKLAYAIQIGYMGYAMINCHTALHTITILMLAVLGISRWRSWPRSNPMDIFWT